MIGLQALLLVLVTISGPVLASESGADAGGEFAEEFETWCSPESEIFVELEGGASLAGIHEMHEGVLPIGDGPAAGSAPSEG